MDKYERIRRANARLRWFDWYYKVSGRNVSKTARHFGISRETFYYWFRRYQLAPSTQKFLVLLDHSRRPKHSPRRTKSRIISKILALRKKHGYCAQKLGYLLREEGIDIHWITIYRILKRKDKIGKQIKHPRPRGQTAKKEKQWGLPGNIQMDVKYVTPELTGMTETYFQYTICDEKTRIRYGEIHPERTMAVASEVLLRAQSFFPFPIQFVQVDNGGEFQSEFRDNCQRLGLKHYYIRIRTPDENAYVERSHRTDQEEFYWRLDEKPRSIEELNAKFQEWIHFYNTERPHLGLMGKTPKQAWNEYQRVSGMC